MGFFRHSFLILYKLLNVGIKEVLSTSVNATKLFSFAATLAPIYCIKVTVHNQR